MPAFVEDEENPAPVEPNLIIAKPDYQTPVVDVRKEGYDSLATFFSGSKLRNDYYQTIQRRDTAASSYNPDMPLVFGQRRRIRDFEIILDGKLDHKQNTQDSMGFSTTGRAVCYGVVVPQPGDVFVAQIGNGRNTLFQINNPERLTPFDESGYSFEFKALKWMDEEAQKRLDESTVERYYFDRENFRNGLKCLLREEEVDTMRRLAAAFRRLTHLFFRDFFDDAYQTFRVPTPMDRQPSYDPNVTKFMRRLIGASDYSNMLKVVELNVSDDRFADQQSVFDAMLAKDHALLYSCAHKWSFVPVSNYRGHPMMRSIYYSGMRLVVSPVDTRWSSQNQDLPGYPGLAFDKAGIGFKDIDYILPDLGVDEWADKTGTGRYIKRVSEDEYYVLSEQFYKDEGELSWLEQMLLARLKGQTIDLNRLAEIADFAPRFNNLERFYYIPIVLYLIKVAPGVL